MAEAFECAVGPVGWRYVATFRSTVVPGHDHGTADHHDGDVQRRSGEPAEGPVVARADVTLDAAGRQIRVELGAGGWLLRGGVAGPDTAWLRTTSGPAASAATRSDPLRRQGESDERSEPAVGFAAFTPAFLVATARLLRRTRPAQRRHRVRLVEVDRGALATRTVEEVWTLVGVDQHETDTGVLPVEQWDVDDLTAGVRGEVYLAGDVVLAAPGVELATLDGPPTVTF